jgi:hypothetical protein
LFHSPEHASAPPFARTKRQASFPPLLQDQGYHQFADQRELLGIANFWNVVSNLPFIAVSAVGLLRVRRDATTTVLFAGLTGFGSSHYHLNPNDDTLFLDRLPVTFCFTEILAAVVEERVDARAGAMLLRPLLAIGIFQSSAMALDRRFAALCLGAIFSFSRIGPDPPFLPAQICRHPIRPPRAIESRRGTVYLLITRGIEVPEHEVLP